MAVLAVVQCKAALRAAELPILTHRHAPQDGVAAHPAASTPRGRCRGRRTHTDVWEHGGMVGADCVMLEAYEVLVVWLEVSRGYNCALCKQTSATLDFCIL